MSRSSIPAPSSVSTLEKQSKMLLELKKQQAIWFELIQKWLSVSAELKTNKPDFKYLGDYQLEIADNLHTDTINLISQIEAGICINTVNAVSLKIDDLNNRMKKALESAQPFVVQIRDKISHKLRDAIENCIQLALSDPFAPELLEVNPRDAIQKIAEALKALSPDYAALLLSIKQLFVKYGYPLLFKKVGEEHYWCLIESYAFVIFKLECADKAIRLLDGMKWPSDLDSFTRMNKQIDDLITIYFIPSVGKMDLLRANRSQRGELLFQYQERVACFLSGVLKEVPRVASPTISFLCTISGSRFTVTMPAQMAWVYCQLWRQHMHNRTRRDDQQFYSKLRKMGCFKTATAVSGWEKDILLLRM